MIRESIVITTDLKNKPHVVPMGITFNKSKLFISPFIPSKTYLNLKERNKDNSHQKMLVNTLN